MSRSKPTSHAANPATRWFEWDGEHGSVRYYDKDTKANVDVGSDFTFVLLDELSAVRGWHERSKSGIYSNEVRDTRSDVLLVQSFKGGIIAQGLYRDIKDKANAAGGRFNANLYIAYAEAKGGPLAIASLKFKGGALGAWMEFRKANQNELYTSAVRLKGYDEGKKGKITFRTPRFVLVPISPSTDQTARELDEELQTYLDSYLASRKTDQAASHAPDEAVEDDAVADYEPASHELSDDDIPF